MKIFYRIFCFAKNNNVLDIVRKVIFYIFCHNGFNNFYRLKSIYYLKSFNVILGRNVTFLGLSNKIEFGKNIRIYPNCIWESSANAKIKIGNNFVFSYGCLFSITKEIEIGDNVMIGEYSSIRDTSHSYNDTEKPFMNQEDISVKIIIGNNVWVGRGVLILPGAFIEDNVIVAANSLVKGHLYTNSIYGGNPCRFIKKIHP